MINRLFVPVSTAGCSAHGHLSLSLQGQPGKDDLLLATGPEGEVSQPRGPEPATTQRDR